jgi:predicted RNase H-like nuclease (RuvC/YqgF family)
MPEKIIFGIDIAKGSVRSKEKPGYAVVILRDGHTENHRMVSLHKFLRMAWKEKPQIIAADNIHELASDRRDLVSFLQKLPSETKLVQVTGGEHLEPLTKLAKQQGFSFDRFDPNAEALACARLAELGIGHEVFAFEDKTIIKVSRARSLGKGGWSQNRYRRKVHDHVRQKAREIEDSLNQQSKASGFTFTQNVSERFGGYSKAEFLVEAPRSALHISSGKYGDVQVSARSIERDALAFQPLKPRKRDYIIVGIDPGTTMAIAVLTLEGELRLLHSSRTISIPDVIEMIAGQGKPLIIASDVFPTPNTVEKTRRAFNAVLGSPDDFLTTEDKIEFAKPFEYSNPHERDAIAAAVSVYRKNRNKFEQIKKKVPSGVDVNEAIAQVVRGKSVDAVILELTRKKIKKPEVERGKQKTDEGSLLLRDVRRRYEENIQELKNYQEELKNELDIKKEKIRELEALLNRQREIIYKELKKEREIKIRDKEITFLRSRISENNKLISFLNKRIHKLKQVRRLEISGMALPVKIISAFTKESILKTREQFGIKKDDIILLKDASGGGTMTSRMLADFGVKAVIICNEMSHAAQEEMFNLNLPVLEAKDVNIRFDSAEEIASINPDDIEIAIREWNKKAEARRIAAKEEWLESLVGEYRSERRRGNKGSR